MEMTLGEATRVGEPARLCPLAIVLAGVLGFGVAHADPPIEAPGSGSVATSSADLSLPPDALPPDALPPDALPADALPADALPPDALPPSSGRDVAVAPAPASHPSRAKAPTTATTNTLFAIKVIGGLVGLLVLTYLGGHRRFVRLQERLGIGGIITAGFPFVALGLFASWPSIGILGPEVIDRLRPILHVGLGWLGFLIGVQLDIRVLDRVPKGTAYLILVETLGPFVITAAASGAVMFAFGRSWSAPGVWRDVVLLGAAAAMTAPRKFRGFANRTWHEGRGVDVLLGQVDELVGVVGLLFITAYFRDTTSSTWILPGTAWVFVSLGLGVAIGVLIFAIVRVPVSNAEFLAIVLGGIAFASGLAGYLHLSPIVICFIAGVMVTNFPNDQRDSIFRILHHLERPMQLLFLIVAGAVWEIDDWRGWVLIPLFVAGRVLGKYAGVLASKIAVGALMPSGFADQRQLVAPMSGLSIALVVSVQSVSQDESLPWIVTAVIGGAMVTELLVRDSRTVDGGPAPAGKPKVADPIDDLDNRGSGAVSGPIYPDDSEPPHVPPTRGDKP
jgi:Kef-type K+ transport system membrane component KefB